MIATMHSKHQHVSATRMAGLLALALAALALGAAAPARAAGSRGAAILAGVVPGETFGCSVSTAGAVNGDTYTDVIVSALPAAPELVLALAVPRQGPPQGVAAVPRSGDGGVLERRARGLTTLRGPFVRF